MAGTCEADAALTEIAELVSAAITHGPISLSRQIAPVANRLGGDCGISPAAVEARIRELLGMTEPVDGEGSDAD